MAEKTFTVMKTQVGNLVNDTSSAFLTLVGQFLNDAYYDANRRAYWPEMIVTDFTFASVVGTSLYSMPSSTGTFLREIKMINVTDGKELECWDIRKWYQERGEDYNASSLTNGVPEKYILLHEQSKIQLDPPANAVKTYAFIYQKEITEMSADANTPEIRQISQYLVYKAASDAFSYYKQYGKADWWLQKAEFELSKVISFTNVSIDQIYKHYPNKRLNFSRRFGHLIGDSSYDSV